MNPRFGAGLTDRMEMDPRLSRVQGLQLTRVRAWYFTYMTQSSPVSIVSVMGGKDSGGLGRCWKKVLAYHGGIRVQRRELVLDGLKDGIPGVGQ